MNKCACGCNSNKLFLYRITNKTRNMEEDILLCEECADEVDDINASKYLEKINNERK